MKRAARLCLAAVTLALPLLLLASPPARAMKVERVTSPGGITAWLVEDHSLPVVSFHLVFRGGAALDPAEKAGLAELTADLLDEGAGDLDSTAFQGREEDLAVSLDFAARADDMAISLRTTAANLDPALDLLRLALTEPRFDAPAVARVRGQLIGEVEREERQPRHIAMTAWWHNAFGGHPYGRAVEGTPKTIARITVADMRHFVRARFAKDVMLVGVVGDITPAALKPRLDRSFGGLAAKAEKGRIADAVASNPGSLLVAPLPIPQSVIAFGEPGVKRSDKDWYAALLVNYVLGGGGFESRLTREVREKRGLAYSVYTTLDPRQHAGLILGGVATENAHVRETIEVIRAEWRRMHDFGPTAEELANAKTYITGSFPLSLDSTGRIAAVLVAIQRDRLGIDYLGRRSTLINRVSLADARRVARRLFDPAALSFVVVGKPGRLAGARELKLAPSAAPAIGAAAAPTRLPSAGAIGQGLR